MVVVAYKWNFDVIFVEFLRCFGFVIDAVFEKSTAFDFPTVVDAAASGQACNDERSENFKKTRVHFIKIKNDCLKRHSEAKG